MRNQWLILLRIPCTRPLLLSCWFQNSYSFGFNNLTIVCLSVDFWVCPDWNLLSFLDVHIHVFIRFGKFISSNIFFCPFYLSGIPVIHVLVHLMVPPVSQALFISLFFFLSTPQNGQFELSSLQVCWSLYFSLLKGFNSRFFLSVILLFNSRISVWFLFTISFSLLRFLFCSYIVFLICF